MRALFLSVLVISTGLFAADAPSFTGKVTKNKVRMRLTPSLESGVVKELSRDELVVVAGESDDFYAVLPPANLKAYIFRTYVLDGVVEGSRVNVRLEPATDGLVIGQLNSGEKIEGTISPANNKWLEVSPPQNVRFYIAKEYIEKVGDAQYLARFTERKDAVNQLLEKGQKIQQEELAKEFFPSVQIQGALESYNAIISNYADFTEQTHQAKEQLAKLQEAYLQKKVVYLETQKLDVAIAAQDPFKNAPPLTANVKLTQWEPVEQQFFHAWQEQNGGGTEDEYRQAERGQAMVLKGIIEPFSKAVRNKPGDYLLLHPQTKTPVAYLYSTRIDLQPYVGQEVALKAVSRPNHAYAYPAYFVIEFEN